MNNLSYALAKANHYGPSAFKTALFEGVQKESLLARMKAKIDQFGEFIERHPRLKTTIKIATPIAAIVIARSVFNAIVGGDLAYAADASTMTDSLDTVSDVATPSEVVTAPVVDTPSIEAAPIVDAPSVDVTPTVETQTVDNVPVESETPIVVEDSNTPVSASATEQTGETSLFAADPNAVKDEDFVDYSNVDYHLNDKGESVLDYHYDENGNVVIDSSDEEVQKTMQDFKNDMKEPETTPETEPPTVPETTPETEPPTVPETTPEQPIVPHTPVTPVQQVADALPKTGDPAMVAAAVAAALGSAGTAGYAGSKSIYDEISLNPDDNYGFVGYESNTSSKRR